MGAKPFMSFLTLPVRVNLTSMTSPDADSTTPGPNVLWETWSPFAKPSWAFAASRRMPPAGLLANGSASRWRTRPLPITRPSSAAGAEPNVRGPEKPEPLSAESGSPWPDETPEPERAPRPDAAEPARNDTPPKRSWALPPAERVAEPNTAPPYAWVPLPYVPLRSPRFSQPTPENPSEPTPPSWMSSSGISRRKRLGGLAVVVPYVRRVAA